MNTADADEDRRGGAPGYRLTVAGSVLTAIALALAAPALIPTGAPEPGSPDGAPAGEEARATPASAPGEAANDEAPGSGARASAQEELPYHPYDGSWTFVRVRTMSRGGRLGRLVRYAGWAHDYPDAERNFTEIVNEFTAIRTRRVSSGGNVLTFQDPRIHKFPIAYVSEPDEWQTTDAEAAALREYLLKGGFVIFDDFYKREMENLVRQMARVFPELRFLPLDGSEEIWRSFFSLEPNEIVLEGPRKSGNPDFYGLYEDNDKSRRMLAVAGAGADIGDLWEWSHRGFYPVDPTNEAYGIGINYLVYAFTH